MQSTLRQRLLASTLIIGASAFATPAWAQPTDDDIQENAAQTSPDATGNSDLQEGQTREDGTITVTGSRIQRRDLTSTSPLAVIQDEEFQLSGATNVEQVLNTLPQVVPGSTGFDNNPGGGVATLQLRGIGPQRTLVLVNGRRWMYYDTNQQVDLNTIPQFLIDSVDVVTGGASAVYGSDAIAGVVNFRLQTDLEGFQAGGSYAITEEGDGRRYNAHVAIGSAMADGRGHVTAFAEYYNRGSIFQGDRAFSRFALTESGGDFIVGGSSTTETTRFQYFGGTNFNNTNAAGLHDVLFNTPGGIRPRTGTDQYNYAPANYLMVPQERWLLGGYGEYEVAPAITAFAEVSFVNNRVSNELAPTPVTGLFDLDVAQTCTFVSAAVCAQLQQLDANETAANAADNDPDTPGVQPVADDPGNVNIFVQRRILETGPRNVLDERNAFRALGGFRGALSDSLNYEAYYMYARTRNSQLMAGNISQSRFQAGLDGSADPINIFGGGTLTPDMVTAITVPTQNSQAANLQVASAAINGVLANFGMGADDIGFALGVEWRSVSATYIPDFSMTTGDVIGFNAGAPTEGGYNVREAFAELRIPIIADTPGFHRLELTGAARYSDYSLEAVGGVWTYAAGAEWAPVSDITFRGQYQRAIRAPSVEELFAGQSVGFPPATDPCSLTSAITNATIRDLCIQTGVPASVLAFGPDGPDAGTDPDPLNANLQLNPQIEGTFRGTPTLQEETADTWTVGVVIRPRFIPRLNITIDGYDIEVDNVIGLFGGGANNILRLCYNVVQNAQSEYCQAINRNPGGILSGDDFVIDVPNANIASYAVRGVDFQLDYTQPLGFSMVGGEESRLNFYTLATYTDQFDITASNEIPDEISECAGTFGVGICGANTDVVPRWKWTSRLSLIDGPMTLTGRWRHVGSVGDDDPESDYVVERIGAIDYFDLAFAFDVSDGLRLTMGVNNLLDTYPTQLGDNQQQANTWPNTYEVIGRDFFISANLRF